MAYQERREHRGGLPAWWADAQLLAALGPALADLHRESEPNTVMGIEARGFLLGALVAVALGVGFVEIRKDLTEQWASGPVLRRTSPPDFSDRSLTLGIRRDLLRPGRRVLLIDDWIETGASAWTARRLVEGSGATWLGVSAIVDGTSHHRRRELSVKALMTVREL
jgi:adenine phosphoribosyltransferase